MKFSAKLVNIEIFFLSFFIMPGYPDLLFLYQRHTDDTD